jgi:hypothetical protein
MPLSERVQMVADASWLREWAPVTVAVCALLFTIGSFWWLYGRRGRLMVTAPQTYAAAWREDKLILLLPLVFYNTGARDYVVTDLRIRFGDEPVGIPLEWERVRSAMNPSGSPELELAAAFPVPGRSAVQLFAEFEREPGNRPIEAREHPLVLETLTDKDEYWHPLLRFDLQVSGRAAQTMQQGRFIAYRNRTRLLSGETDEVDQG